MVLLQDTGCYSMQDEGIFMIMGANSRGSWIQQQMLDSDEGEIRCDYKECECFEKYGEHEYKSTKRKDHVRWKPKRWCTVTAIASDGNMDIEQCE